jgi:carbonic anhydrase
MRCFAILLTIACLPAADHDSNGRGRSFADAVAAHGGGHAAATAADAAHAAHAAHAVPAGIAPIEALARLSAGNARFIAGRRERSADTADDPAERARLAAGQQPFAAILTCADSRVPPELLFDQSLGELFVVRNAGNVADPVGEGSLEYAVEHLGVRLVVVLGHGSCGAVKAVCGAGGALPGHLADIQRAMPGLREHAEERARAGRSPEGAIADAVARNATAQAEALLAGSPALAAAAAGGRLAVLPAVYDLAAGTVAFLPPAAPRR